MLSALFRLLACVCKTMVLAQSVGAFTLLALVISSGFAIVRTSIPGWWCVLTLKNFVSFWDSVLPLEPDKERLRVAD